MAYLRILKQAAQGLESDVAQALSLLLAGQTIWDDSTVAGLVKTPAQLELPDILPEVVNLSLYDQLLEEVDYVTA